MTVAELIWSLQSLGIEKQNLPVIIRGYEGGSNEVCEIRAAMVAWNYHKSENGEEDRLFGRHQIVDDSEYDWLPAADPNLVLTDVVHLVGRNP